MHNENQSEDDNGGDQGENDQRAASKEYENRDAQTTSRRMR